jgi:hypothetical protein
METSPEPQANLPTADKDGMYTCDLCHMKVWVGCGGCKNFMQHRRSPACMRAAEKGTSKASHTKKRVNTLHSYFTKPKQGGPTKGPTQVQHPQQHHEQCNSQNEVALSKPLSNSESTAAPNATPALSANEHDPKQWPSLLPLPPPLYCSLQCWVHQMNLRCKDHCQHTVVQGQLD